MLLIRNFISRGKKKQDISIRDMWKCISVFLFHDWFPLKFIYTHNISLMWWETSNKYLLELIKRRSKV